MKQSRLANRKPPKAGNGLYASRMNPDAVTTRLLDGEIEEAIDWIAEIHFEAIDRKAMHAQTLSDFEQRLKPARIAALHEEMQECDRIAARTKALILAIEGTSS